MHTKIAQIYQEIVDNGDFDNVREFDVEQFQQTYELDEPEAYILWENVQAHVDATHDVNQVTDEEAPSFLEIIREDLHQGLDGWTESDKMVIRAYLAATARAVDEWE